MVVLQLLCQVIEESDWPAVVNELQWQEVIKVQLVEVFALRHNQQAREEGSLSYAPCSLHASLYAAKHASWLLRAPGKAFCIMREPALMLDFGWQSILLTLACLDDYQDYFKPSVNHDLNVLRVASFEQPRRLLESLSFAALEPMLRSRLSPQGAFFSCIALASPRSNWKPWYEKGARLWLSIAKQETIVWAEANWVIFDTSFGKKLFEKVGTDFQVLVRAASVSEL